MSSHKPQQRHITIRGRNFHFVSYQGSRGNPQRAQLPYPAMWYLMVEGRRCPVLPCDPSLSPTELDATLAGWVEDNALGPVESAHLIPLGPARPTENWWGPN
jgi:hypothetical protein